LVEDGVLKEKDQRIEHGLRVKSVKKPEFGRAKVQSIRTTVKCREVKRRTN